jgi:hypothetical protein
MYRPALFGREEELVVGSEYRDCCGLVFELWEKDDLMLELVPVCGMGLPAAVQFAAAEVLMLVRLLPLRGRGWC